MKKLLIIFSLTLVMVLSFTGIASAADWQWITSTDTTTISFDPNRIRVKDKDTYSVWIKNEYTDSYGKEFAEKYNLKESVSYNLTLFEFSYRSEGLRILSEIYYTNNGEVIDSFNYNPILVSFNPIIPNSIGEEIFLVTYNEFKQQYGK